MSETALLADHIDRQIDSILTVWKQTVERFGDVPDAGRLSDREFADHIPDLLERLAARLRGEVADAAEAGQKHGQHRWSQGYDIAEVVTELGHLRSTLVRDLFKFARRHHFDDSRIEHMIEAIDAVIDEAMAQSVRQFQEDGLSLNRTLLDEYERRKADAEADRIKVQTVLKLLPVGVWVVDASGDFLGINREAERLQALTLAETPDKLHLGALPLIQRVYRPDGSEYAAADLPLARALRGETIVQEDMTWPTKAGLLSITTDATPITSADGSILGAIVVVQDISDRKRLEADLAISEARFRAIVEKSPVLNWRTDQAGQVDFFNQTWLDFRGRTDDQESRDGWAEGVHPDDLARRLESFRRAFEHREPFAMVYRLRDAGGHYRWMTDRAAPYHDGRGTFLGYLGSCLDISDRIEMEAKLEQQSQHKSRLMSALSHDARTPLNAVVLSAKLLESQAKDQDDPEVQECLTTIRNSVRNVLDLLSDLLDLSRIDAGATLAETSRFELRATLAECLSSIEPQARAKGLEICLDAGGLDRARVDTDRAKLKQILSNLLSNALRYTESGSIRLFATRSDATLKIGVQDTGVGIAQADHRRIFDEFAVLEHPNRARTEGTGLGLAICRRLANLLHGEIQLESEPGRGSTFTLALPDSVLTSETAPAEPAGVAPARDFTGAILIAEDHSDSRKTLAKVLRRMGYRVLEAGDGMQVLDLVRQETPMVILMDVNMPELDGVETTLAIRRDPATRSIPIFALTGDVSVLNQQRIGDAGVDGYLEKPVTWEKLEAALAYLKTLGGLPPA